MTKGRRDIFDNFHKITLLRCFLLLTASYVDAAKWDKISTNKPHYILVSFSLGFEQMSENLQKSVPRVFGQELTEPFFFSAAWFVCLCWLFENPAGDTAMIIINESVRFNPWSKNKQLKMYQSQIWKLIVWSACL